MVSTTLFDIYGRTIFSGSEVSTGDFLLVLQMQNYPTGVYYVKIEVGEQVLTTRLIRQ
jgi:hypothetical protein